MIVAHGVAAPTIVRLVQIYPRRFTYCGARHAAINFAAQNIDRLESEKAMADVDDQREDEYGSPLTTLATTR
jgi:hypothetical protein